MIKPAISFFFVVILFIFTACNENSDAENKTDLNPLWQYEQDLIANGETLSVNDYNQSIEKALSMRLPWAYSPLSIALRIAGQQMVTPEVNLVAKSLSGNELITHTVVVVEKKGMTDDSLQDEYYRVELKLGGSIWQVTQVKKAWRCAPNRGHQQLSAVPCG